MDVRLESAVPADAPRFTAMERAAGTREFLVAVGEAAHRANLADPAQTYLRIVVDGRIGGYIVLVRDPDGRSIEFRRIVVADPGRGIGQRAIPLMERYCRERVGAARVWLEVFEHNARGRHVYEKLGYTRCGETEYDGVPARVCDKRLEPA